MRKLAFVLVAACSGSPRPAPAPAPLPEMQPTTATPAVVQPAPTQMPAHPIAKDTYHGVVVEDRYRWLEQDTPEVKAWADAIDQKTRAQLGAIPEAAKLHDEVAAIMNAPITEYWGFKVAGGKLFGMRRPPGKEQPQLIVMSD